MTTNIEYLKNLTLFGIYISNYLVYSDEDHEDHSLKENLHDICQKHTI